jgi:hypothetical protein
VRRRLWLTARPDHDAADEYMAVVYQLWVLDDFSSGAALVAKLRHCVRNKQIGR